MKTFSKLKIAGLSLAAFCALFILSSAALKIATPNFAGQWTLNEGKSELGQFGARMSARKMTVTADATGMSVTKTMNGQNGETTTTDKLTFDGKETESMFFGDNKKKSVAKWSADGQSLIVTWTAAFNAQGNNMEIKGTDTWTLTPDGSLSVASATTSSFGNISTKLVYDKAK